MLVSAAVGMTEGARLSDVDLDDSAWTMGDVATMLISLFYLLAAGTLFGIGLRCARRQAKTTSRDVGTQTRCVAKAARDSIAQSPVTYARKRSNPRFVPLSEGAWGAW